MLTLLQSKKGAESVEFAMGLPAFVALIAAVIGAAIFGLRALATAFDNARAVRVAEVYEVAYETTVHEIGRGDSFVCEGEGGEGCPAY